MTDSTPANSAMRKHRSNDERRRIVELTFEKGASITQIAREHGMHPTSLSHWRSLYQSGKLSADASSAPVAQKSAFFPIALTQENVTNMPPSTATSVQERERNIVQLTLPSGATVRIETTSLDVVLLRALVAQVQA
jgi:transposase-like protein